MLPFTRTELEWRFLAGDCETEAAVSRERAAACPPEQRGNARDFLHSAQLYESLAAECMRNVKAAALRPS